MTAPVLCWDIDGTLLSTARAGVFALESAALAVTGRPLDLQQLPTAGLTDVEIARLVLERNGVTPTADHQRQFLTRYEDDLPASLPRRQGQVMPGVVAILEALRVRPDWGSMLLTGNTRRGAQAKLTHYGLAGYFLSGAFSDDTRDRAEIAAKALRLIRAERPGHPANRVVVIGDTPHDVACARAIGARCLAVATGGYPSSALEQTGADRVVAQLPAPEAFWGMIEEICSRG
ncbi:MAG TPA: haloacid dehalogenase-like hydrolase [Opitutaceae bacterium]|nr:haloacid dehalogenase-like hydrolase [Opitutaceae bacterium]